MAGAGATRWVAGLFAGVWLMGVAEPGLGQGYVEPPCTAQAAPVFEDHLQSLWYRRFWTGECRDLPGLRCMRGRPYWNDVVRTLAARAPVDQRSEIAARACRLGRRIGFEWTRPSDRRRIDTRDLRSLAATLDNSPDVTAGLAAVEARVQARIGR